MASIAQRCAQRSTIKVKGALAKLTPMQYRVFHLLKGTLSQKEMAAKFGIHVRTLRAHVGNVYVKTGVTGRVGFWTKFGFHPEQ